MPTYTYTTIDEPSGRNTAAFGINSAGQIVGEYLSNGARHGFLYGGGTYTTLDEYLPKAASFRGQGFFFGLL